MWSKDEDKWLINNFKLLSNSEIAQKLNKNIRTIEKRKSKLNLKKMIHWTEEEEKLLYESWKNLPLHNIKQLFPNRSLRAIRTKASELKIPRNYYVTKIDCLLEESADAYQWAGAITADGSVSEHHQNNAIWYTLQIGVSLKDKKYWDILFKQISSYVRINTDKNMYYLQSSHPKIKDFMVKFNLYNCKTYNPPKLDLFNNWVDWQFISYFVGLIHGDGCITIHKKNNIPHILLIQHKTWHNFHLRLAELCYKFFNIKPKVGIHNYNNTSYCNIYSLKDVKTIKHKILQYPITLLERKWNKIII